MFEGEGEERRREGEEERASRLTGIILVVTGPKTVLWPQAPGCFQNTNVGHYPS